MDLHKILRLVPEHMLDDILTVKRITESNSHLCAWWDNNIDEFMEGTMSRAHMNTLETESEFRVYTCLMHLINKATACPRTLAKMRGWSEFAVIENAVAVAAA